MHGIACVSFLKWHGLCRSENIFSIVLPFSGSFDEMGSLIQFMWLGQLDLNLSGVDI